MIPKIVAMIESLFSMSYQYNIALPTMPVAVKETIQGRFDEIVEYIKTLFQFNDIIQFIIASKTKNIVIFIILSGIVITMIVLLIKSAKIKELLYPGKIKVAPKRVLLATGHLLKDIISAFPPVIRTVVALIIVIVGLGLFSKNNMTDTQLPKASAPALAPAPVPAPAPAPAPKPATTPTMPNIIEPDSVRGKWKAVKLIVTYKETEPFRQIRKEGNVISVGSWIEEDKFEIEVNLHDEFQMPYSNLKVAVGDFLPDFKLDGNTITSLSNKPNNPAVDVRIYDNGREVYKGWLYSKFPTIHPFEHPRYSITLKEGIHALSSSKSSQKIASLNPVSSSAIDTKLAPALIPEPSTEGTPRLKASDRRETIRLTLAVGNGFYNDKNYEKAIEMFEKVLALEPDNKEAIKGIEKAKRANGERYPNSKEAEVEKKLKEIAKRREQSLLPEKRGTIKGRIYVNSEPPSADIYINGNYKARTPAEISLVTGDYTVVLIKVNYKTESIPVNIKEGMNLPLSVRLSPK